MEDEFSEGRTCRWPTRIALRSGFHHTASKLPSNRTPRTLRGLCTLGRVLAVYLWRRNAKLATPGTGRRGQSLHTARAMV
jgi:hypothetical protein